MVPNTRLEKGGTSGQGDSWGGPGPGIRGQLGFRQGGWWGGDWFGFGRGGNLTGKTGPFARGQGQPGGVRQQVELGPGFGGEGNGATQTPGGILDFRAEQNVRCNCLA